MAQARSSSHNAWYAATWSRRLIEAMVEVERPTPGSPGKTIPLRRSA